MAGPHELLERIELMSPSPERIALSITLFAELLESDDATFFAVARRLDLALSITTIQ